MINYISKLLLLTFTLTIFGVGQVIANEIKGKENKDTGEKARLTAKAKFKEEMFEKTCNKDFLDASQRIYPKLEACWQKRSNSKEGRERFERTCKVHKPEEYKKGDDYDKQRACRERKRVKELVETMSKRKVAHEAKIGNYSKQFSAWVLGCDQSTEISIQCGFLKLPVSNKNTAELDLALQSNKSNIRINELTVNNLLSNTEQWVLFLKPQLDYFSLTHLSQNTQKYMEGYNWSFSDLDLNPVIGCVLTTKKQKEKAIKLQKMSQPNSMDVIGDFLTVQRAYRAGNKNNEFQIHYFSNCQYFVR